MRYEVSHGDEDDLAQAYAEQTGNSDGNDRIAEAYYIYTALTAFIFLGAIAWAVQANPFGTASSGACAYVTAVHARKARYQY